ncbi:CDT1-like protein b [Cucumis melo var. makuwa]|uniref:CDT1-like protein b n=1 Tax=Cucumis melo var. makuwa TaxID=1194695 RepID=A0A5D3DKW1_CUCMM|nr:CDT1-like protein b [Cucumis melo var. makuwa]
MADASKKISSSSSSSSSSTLPFKSKKPLRSNSKSLLEDPQSLSSKTPEKPAELSTRTRNRKVALSIKEVKRAALSVTQSNRQLPLHLAIEESKSVRRQIDLWSNESQSVDNKSKKFPEKFEMLCKFFYSLDSAMRLLRFKGVASNFSNVCPKIEALTDRRFTYGHLAQFKFILREAIVLKKVLVYDERTCCMKPDLHISFNFGVPENQEDQYMQLRKLFRARLSEFVSSYPETDDVPKDLLPNPFNFRSQDLVAKSNSLSSIKTSIEQLAPEQPMPSIEGISFNHHSEEHQGFRMVKSTMPVTDPSKQKEFIGLSHFSPSFSRRFSQKVVDREIANNDQVTKPSNQVSSYTDVETNIDMESSVVASSTEPFSPIKLPSNSTCNVNCHKNYASPIRCSALALPTTPSNTVGRVTMMVECDQSAKANDIDSTPGKLLSTPTQLMTNTPAMPPPKRSSMTPDDDSSFSTNKLVRRPPRSRSLVFDTPTKEDKNNDETDVSLEDDILDVLSSSLVQSIKEKERKVKEEQMPAITQAKRRQKMIANLPKLFNAIFFLYHKRTVIRKQKLLNEIIAGSDKREIEEQLDLLFELAPEWIYPKLTSGGDVLVCINKLANVESVRVRLEEAK